MSARHSKWLAGIVVLGAVLRFATLDVQSYWLDEAVTVELLERGLGDMLRAIPGSESTPPLYYVLARAWSQVFGTGEVGLRSLSALAGTATIPVAYAIGARALSVRAGLIAGALVAANPLLVWYSQEARSYALLVLLTSLTVLAAMRADERPTVGRLSAWAAVGGAALATHYFAVFVLLPEVAWLLWRHRRLAVGPVANVALVGLALLPVAVEQSDNDRASFIGGESLLSRIAAVPKQSLVGYDAPGEVLALVVTAALALLALALLARRSAGAARRAAAPLGALAAVAVAVPLVVALAGADYLLTRNVIAWLVPALVVLAIGFAVLRTRWSVVAAAALAAVGVAMCVVVAVEDSAQRGDWRALAGELGAPPDARLIVVRPASGRLPLEVYLPNARALRPNEQPPVREIHLIFALARGFGADETPPRPKAPGIRGFSVTRRHETDTYTLISYRSARPIAVPYAPLRGGATSAGADLLVQAADPPPR